jgi:hypothetical protein
MPDESTGGCLLGTSFGLLLKMLRSPRGPRADQQHQGHEDVQTICEALGANITLTQSQSDQDASNHGPKTSIPMTTTTRAGMMASAPMVGLTSRGLR